MQLDEFPLELLVLVFSYLPARFLILKVILVCHKFRDVIKDEWFWKERFLGCCGSEFSVRVCSMQTLQLGCVQSEFVHGACNENATHMNTVVLPASTGGLDCVHIMRPSVAGVNCMVAAGSRDHIVYLWKRRQVGRDFETTGGRSMRQFTSTPLSGHRGWVWCLSSHVDNPNVLCSGGWDSQIWAWDLAVGQKITNIKKQHKAAVLSLAFPEHETLISGSYDTHVRGFDLRQDGQVAANIGAHDKPVLAVETHEHYVYSASEDCTIRTWDRRVPQRICGKEKLNKTVTSISLNHGLLSAVSGQEVYLFSITEGSLFLETKFDSGHKQALTTVYHNLGMLVTGSQDDTVRVFSMGTDHRLLTTFQRRGDVTDVDFNSSTLAIASADRTVSLWQPRHLS